MNNRKEKTILVTGATGTVGSEVVKQLAAISSSSGHKIRAAVHSKNKTGQLGDKRVEIVDLDYTKPETVAYALNSVDKIFLQTLPTPNVTDISSNLVNEAKKNSVKYIVKLSAIGASDSESRSTILRLHGEEEKIIEDSGIPYTFLRPPAFMQNFVTQFGNTIRTQNAFYVPAGDAKMSFVDTRDIGAVAAVMLTNTNHGASQQHENKAYDITGQDALSYRQVADILSNEVGKKISYIDITEDDARKGMKQIGMDEWFINIMIELFRIIRAGYGSETTTAVEHITGRKPISFAQFAKDYAEALR
ncbi:MAG TPA: SDR family oxidoreductase [Nitrososphaeraceae archaeon]|nr:SDR family oxidoreductase [Nitrososphaeraceae archaeon]